MARRSVVLWPLLAALLAVVAGDTLIEDAHVTPLLAWASTPCLRGGDAVLEAATDLSAVLADAVASLAALGGGGGARSGAVASPLVDPKAAGQGAEVVLVLLGSQLRTSDLRRPQAGPLKELMAASASSAAMPHVLHEPAPPAPGAGGPAAALRAALSARIAGAAPELQTAGCGEGRALTDLPQLLPPPGGAAPGGPALLLGCVGGGAAAGADGAAGEARRAKEAHDAVAALGLRQVTLFGVDPHLGAGSSDAPAAQRRRLAAAAGAAAGYSVCDARCKTQVKWLEGMLALLILIVAALSGLCCLGMLDTPTRFEAPKDVSRND